jgi:CHASE2 domain-containing sensor protein
MNGVQCIAYGIHFALLGNPTAAASSPVSSARSFLSVRTRSPLVATLLVAANLIIGLVFSHSGVGWLPVVASSGATVAIFVLSTAPRKKVSGTNGSYPHRAR